MLVVFNESQPGAPNRQAAAIERMQVFVFALTGAVPSAVRQRSTPEPEIGASRLEGFEVRARRNFLVLPAGGEPDFEVVSLRRAESALAGGKSPDTVPVAVILAARLPYGVIGTNSPI